MSIGKAKKKCYFDEVSAISVDLNGPGMSIHYQKDNEVLSRRPTSALLNLKSARAQPPIEVTPGPGHYKAEKSHQTSARTLAVPFAKSKRPSLFKSQSGTNLGPAYQYKSTLSDKSHVIPKEERSRSRIESSPGPGHFTPTLGGVKSGSPSVKIGRSRRNTDWSIPTKENPGPGAYYSPTKNELTKIVRWKMPSKERTADFFKIYDTPGPGQYTSRLLSRNTSTHRFTSAKR